MIKETVRMPTELSAENGGKVLMVGEFHETITVDCLAYGDLCYDKSCENCGGSGEFTQEVTIKWDTIKAIYAKAVDHFGR